MTIDVELEDGTVVEGVPEGTTKAQLMERVNKMRSLKESQARHEATAAAIEADPISRGARKFPAEEGGFLAGMGSAVKKYGLGAAQVLAPFIAEAVSPGFSGERKAIEQEITSSLSEAERERRRLNVPLERTATGKLGQVAGDIAMVAPATVIPGANTVAGSALIGGATGALQPTLDDESRLVNTMLGAGLAGGVSAGLKGITLLRAARQAAGSKEAMKNAMRDATLREGFEAGYSLPPSEIRKGGTFLGNRLEGIAGKAALKQEAAIRNQAVTNRLASRAVGLPDDVPISEGALEAARNTMAQPYREVAALSKRAAKALKDLRQARNEATRHYQHYERTLDPKVQDTAREFSAKAAKLEKVIDAEALKVGRADLLPALRDARVALAKTYDIERALNVATGDIDAGVIGRMLDKGRPLTGELRTIGRFQQAFPSYTRSGVSAPAPGVSKLEGFGAAALGIGGAAATGHPAGMLAAGLPFLSSPTRSLLLSQMMQSVPKYGPGAMLRLADLTARNPTIQRSLPPLIAAGIVPQVQQ